MHSGGSIIPVLLVAIVIFTAMCFYLVGRFAVIFGKPIESRTIQLFISLLLVLFVFLLQASNFLDGKIFSMISTVGSWIFIAIPLVCVMMLVVQGFQKILPEDCGKLGGIVSFCLLFLSVFGFGIYNAFSTKVTEVTIETDKIGQNMDIMFVADTHVNDVINQRHLQTIRKEIGTWKPNLVLFGGDFFDRANVKQVKYFGELAGIHLPMYGVGGNHDGMGQSEAMTQLQELTNVILLDRLNQSVVVPDLGIRLVGIEDKSQWRGRSVSDLLDKIDDGLLRYARNDDELFTILMTHQPVGLEKLNDFNIDLELAGHTHRGQIYGARELASLFNDYLYGLYENPLKKGVNYAFVTQGIGTWGLPLRLGSRSEIVVIHLRVK